MMKRRTSNLSLRPEANVRDILELMAVKFFPGKYSNYVGFTNILTAKVSRFLTQEVNFFDLFSLYFII